MPAGPVLPPAKARMKLGITELPSAVTHLMRVATGTVGSGSLVLDEHSLEERSNVWVVTRELESEVQLSPEELA